MLFCMCPWRGFHMGIAFESEPKEAGFPSQCEWASSNQQRARRAQKTGLFQKEELLLLTAWSLDLHLFPAFGLKLKHDSSWVSSLPTFKLKFSPSALQDFQLNGHRSWDCSASIIVQAAAHSMSLLFSACVFTHLLIYVSTLMVLFL